MATSILKEPLGWRYNGAALLYSVSAYSIGFYGDEEGARTHIKTILTPDAEQTELEIVGPERVVIDTFDYLSDRHGFEGEHFKSSGVATA